MMRPSRFASANRSPPLTFQNRAPPSSIVRSSLVVINALRSGKSASRAFSRSRAVIRSACKLPKVVIERVRSANTVEVRTRSRRCRTVSRLTKVDVAMIAAIAEISSTRVRMPRFSGCWRVIDLEGRGSLSEAFASRDKFVSCTVNRQQVAWVRWIRLQLLPQFQYLVVYSTGRGVAVVAPHLIQQFFPAQNAFGMLGEEFQQPELVGCQRNRHIASACRHLLKIQLAASESIGRGRSRFAPAPDGGLHTRHQFARTERFGHIVIGTEFE